MAIDPNLIPIFGIVFGMPSIALAIRWVMKPVMDAHMRSQELKARAAASPALQAEQERRIADLEAELATVKHELERLSAVESFYAQLGAGPPPGRDLPPGTDTTT